MFFSNDSARDGDKLFISAARRIASVLALVVGLAPLSGMVCAQQKSLATTSAVNATVSVAPTTSNPLPTETVLPTSQLYPNAPADFAFKKINIGDEAELITIYGSTKAMGERRPRLSNHLQLPKVTTVAPDASGSLLPFAASSSSSTLTGNASESGAANVFDETRYIPLVSVLRDTMGDRDPTNDRLRQVWMLTFTSPSVKQHLAAALPFYYGRAGNRAVKKFGVPSPILDLAEADGDVWRRLFLRVLEIMIGGGGGGGGGNPSLLGVTARTYRRNRSDYRRTHVLRALAVMWLYEQSQNTAQAFTSTELAHINGRLMLREAMFGGIVDDVYMPHVYLQRRRAAENTRGHTHELLRMRAENEKLHFQPLTTPNGDATHAILWVRQDDLPRFRYRDYDKRFLNINNPFTDSRLLKWKGYTETWYFNARRERVLPDEATAHPVTMIPLAVYGLEHPRIPILLIDFRDRYNAKRREISRLLLQDVTRNLLGIARFGDLYFFTGRMVYDFVLGKRGMDINQPSRVESYSQLKLLLQLDSTLSDELRDELERRVEKVAVNPFANDADTEARIARAQHAALLDYAARPDGMMKLVQRNRRRELARGKSSMPSRALKTIGEFASFGAYKSQAAWTAESRRELAFQRQLDYHTLFIREVAADTPVAEIAYDIEAVRASLAFIAQHGEQANNQAAQAIAKIFNQTQDAEAQHLCLASLNRINNEAAKSALVRINREAAPDTAWRTLSREYLRQSLAAAHKFSKQDAQTVRAMFE